MRKIETQSFLINHRSFLFDMSTQNSSQRFMQQVSCTMVISSLYAFTFINQRYKTSTDILWKFIGNMNIQVVFFFCIPDYNFLVIIVNKTFITNLSTTFGIKRSLIKNKLIKGFIFGFHLAVFQNFNISRNMVITNKNSLFYIVFKNHPIFSINSCSLARTVFLFFHCFGKTFHINR